MSHQAASVSAATANSEGMVEMGRDAISGLAKIKLKDPTRGSTAEVFLYGGQVTSWKNERGEEMLFRSSKIDRVYLSTPTRLAVIDHELKRTFVLRKSGLPDAAVWNPWEKKAKAIPDFGDEEYMRTVCIEAAAVEKPITLKPGEEWTGRQELEVVSSSYFSGQMDPVNVKPA